MSALLTAALCGCSLHGDAEMLESELRRQERAQQELTAELSSVREELRIARTDASALREQLAQRRQFTLASEQAEVLYRIEAIKFNALLTSGQDRDGKPGDDGLSVMLLPVDAHGDLVKLAGELELELFDMALEGAQQRLGQWQFSTEEVRQHWHKGFLSTGYLFQLDWQRPPQSSELTLHARLTIPDGRRFDATTQVKLVPPGQVQSPVAQAGYEAPGPRTRQNPPAGAGAGQAAAPGRATVRRPAIRPAGAPPRPLRSGLQPNPLAPRVQPAAPGHADLPTQTSDNWTDETIPRLR